MTDSALVIKVCVALFVTTSLLHAGLALTVAQVRSPLRSPWLVGGALIGNFVLVPAVALLIVRLFHLAEGLSLGLLLVGMSAGAPFLPRLVELAQGNAALGVAIGIGFISGGTSPECRCVLALGTGQRGISAALLIATHVAQDPDAAVMVVVVVLMGEAILFSAAAGAAALPV